MFDLIARYRGFFITVFVLPLSVGFRIFHFLQDRFIRQFRDDPSRHDQRVGNIQEEVRLWKSKTEGEIPMCTGRPGWQTMCFKVGRYKKTSYRVSTHTLRDILEIDAGRRVVRVEPMVTMGEITKALNLRGWTLSVVPELDALTVGGLINGFGIETSSHQYGLFQHICLSLDIVLPDGSLVKCSKEKNAQLFHAIPWSHGSLGFLVAAELMIIPARKYVHLTYEPIFMQREFVRRFEEESRNSGEDPPDFVEGILFSEHEGVVITGRLTDRRPERVRINALNRFWKPWFYEHVRTYLHRRVNGDELIPLRHYYHRHTRSLFWEMKSAIPFGNHPLFRWFFGWMGTPEVSLLKLTETKKIHELYEAHHMDQDFIIPIQSLKTALGIIHRNIDLYPLWFCPARLFPPSRYRGMVYPRAKDDLFVDVGIYGEPQKKPYHPEKSHRELEAFVRKVGGYQALYADTYQTKKEFRQMFDHSLIDQLREKYQCKGALLEVYDKVSRQARK